MAYIPTYNTAMAAGRDAANRSAKKAGRLSWTSADYREAWRAFENLMRACYGSNRADWPTR